MCCSDAPFRRGLWSGRVRRSSFFALEPANPLTKGRSVSMKIRYFVVEGQRLRKGSQAQVERAWAGEKAWDASHGELDLRILTMLTDNSFGHVISFLLRVKTSDGWITQESTIQALWAALHWTSKSGEERGADPQIKHQLEGWPDDWRQQLAVAADLPLESIDFLGVGGPLPMSLQLDVPVREVVKILASTMPERSV